MNLTRHLHQTATFWASTGQNDLYGKTVYTAPVQIKCRWETKNELFQSKYGEERTSKAKVISITPMDVNGYLFLGTSSETDPTKLPGAWEIQGLGMYPDLRALQQLIVAYL